jgi:hypothetical protein
MCGTHHPVGTPACTTCRASGVTQLRLMFECPTCGRLGLNPTCEACLPPVAAFVPYEVVEEDLIVAEEIQEEPLSLDDAADSDDDLKFDFDEDEEDEKVVIDLSDDEIEEDEDDSFTEFDDDFDDHSDFDELDDLDEEFGGQDGH